MGTWKKLAYADDAILKSLLTEQGDIIYASAASTPAALPHGVAGQYLKTGGDAANPSWDTPAGGGIPTPICITLWQSEAFSVWTNMPAALTEFKAFTNTRTKLVLTSATQSRITVRVGTNLFPAAAAKIKAQYSTDESTWADLCSVTIPTANTTSIGAWTNVPAGAKADVFIRVVGIDGDGAADPNFGLITLQVT